MVGSIQVQKSELAHILVPVLQKAYNCIVWSGPEGVAISFTRRLGSGSRQKACFRPTVVRSRSVVKHYSMYNVNSGFHPSKTKPNFFVRGVWLKPRRFHFEFFFKL